MKCSHKLQKKPRMYMRGSTGFTLVEVLATLLLMAIVLPTVMGGLSLAVQASTSSRHRNEAAGLAEGKLNELVSTGEWQTGNLSGVFDGDFSNYRWDATVSAWDEDTSGEGLQQINLKVSWQSRNQTDSVTFSTLTYVRSAS